MLNVHCAKQYHFIPNGDVDIGSKTNQGIPGKYCNEGLQSIFNLQSSKLTPVPVISLHLLTNFTRNSHVHQ